MANYLYKINAVSKATNTAYNEFKTADANEYAKRLAMLTRISSVIYTYEKRHGKWAHTATLRCA